MFDWWLKNGSKTFVNADIDRVFDALKFGAILVQVWQLKLEVIKKYKIFKLQKRCKNLFRGIWFLIFSSFSDSFCENMSDITFVAQTLLFPTKTKLTDLEASKTV